MLHSLIPAAAAASLCLSLWLSVGFGKQLRPTSLTTAWSWGLAAEFAWFLSATLTAAAAVSAPLLDQFWYWSAVLSTCPMIAVLGARRPTARVWNWFIILPLIAVLGWPAATVFGNSGALPALKVQTPVFVGFLLVLVMGLGNYAGTRFGRPAAFAGLGIATVLIPASSLVELTPGAANLIRSAAALSVSVGILDALQLSRRPGIEQSAYDRLWFDFRDLFGIVWAIRIQERLNETAGREDWAIRLGPDGFEWDQAASEELRKATLPRLDHALRWHLRRFVDPEWIDQRLSAQFVPQPSTGQDKS